MIIIPELETVVILVPRTGSGSLRRAIAATYPKSFLLYRHMEADGVPIGYDRWRRLGVVRDPTERLWSLYKFLQTFDSTEKPDSSGNRELAYTRKMRQSVELPFSRWIIENETVFTSPYDSANLGRYWVQFTVRHALPENRKSQFMYLRPDLGTEVYRFEDLNILGSMMGLHLPMINKSPEQSIPELSDEVKTYIARAFAWDIAVTTEKEPA